MPNVWNCLPCVCASAQVTRATICAYTIDTILCPLKQLQKIDVVMTCYKEQAINLELHFKENDTI